MKTVADPERRRSELEISVLSVVRFVPFDKGTVDAGAATGVYLFFQAQPGFFFQKKWGCNHIRLNLTGNC